MNNKFLGAYCQYLNDYLSIDEIVEIEKKDKDFFQQNISHNLYCPECKLAPLSIVHGDSEYLRAYAKSVHGEDCSLMQNIISNAAFIKIIESDSNNEFLSKKLNDFADYIFLPKKNNQFLTPLTIEHGIDENAQTDTTANKKTKNSKYIPRQNISNGIFVEDIGVYKFFYGELYLMWYKNKNNDNVKKLLAFPLHHNKKSVFSITMSSRVSDYVKNDLPIQFNKLQRVKVVFLSVLNKYNNYYNFHIKHSAHFIVKS